MKFVFFIFAVLMCLAQGVFADDAATIAAYIKTTTDNDLNAEVNSNTVTVTGRLPGAPSSPENYLTLNLDDGVTVVWKATLDGTPTRALIRIEGGSGEFQVVESGSIKNTGSGRAIENRSASVITVSGNAVISSNNNGPTIYLDDVGTATDRFIINGGTVENTYSSSSSSISPANNAIENNSIGSVNVLGGTVSTKGTAGGYAIRNTNSNPATINISGGTVISATTQYAINCNGGTVNISGGTVNTANGSAIICSGTVNISGGTVSSMGRYKYAIYSNSNDATVNISGGIVSSAGVAIYIASGTANVSGDAKITSTGSTTVSVDPQYYAAILIRDSSGKLNMDGGTVELSGKTDHNGGAIFNAGGTVNISSGTVKSTSINAILNFNTLKITGGTILAPTDPSVSVYRNYAILDSASAGLTLGGNPTITGKIHIYPEKLSVLNSDPDIFDPGEEVYTLDFPANQYALSKIAVNNGKNFLDNFAIYNPDWVLITSSTNLITAKSDYKVSFDLNYAIISEDFEGSTHSFTIENGSQHNHWVVGAGTAADGSTKSAYISNSTAAGGEGYGYTTTSASTAHIYRTVEFPESSYGYILKFNWKGQGEQSSDYASVYLVYTSSKITAGSLPTGTVLGTFRGQSSWQQASVKIPVSNNSGTAKQLVFTWRNDDRNGSNPPIAIDNIELIMDGYPATLGVLSNSTVNNARKPSPSAFTRPDYVNDGEWYIDPAGETKFVFGDGGTAVDQDITLYLKWTPSEPSSSSEGGSSSSSSEDTPSSSSEGETPSSSSVTPSSSSVAPSSSSVAPSSSSVAPSSSSIAPSSGSENTPSSSSAEGNSSSSSENATSSSSSGETPSSNSVAPSSSSEDAPSSSSGEDIMQIRLPQIANSNQATQIHNGINLQVTRNAVVEIYGLDGKLIGKQNFSGGVYNVSLGYLPKGLYIVNASFGGEKKVLKVPVR
jgi:hypothetical protein